jgi:RNA polymerase sigma factor (sigma-70 family)
VLTIREETEATRNGAAETAFGLFFDEHHARLYRALAVITQDPHEAEEISQEAFVRVWAKWDRISGMDNPEGYLYRVAMNFYRQRQRWSMRAARYLLNAARGLSEDVFERVGVADELERLILQLPARQRAALVVTEYLGYDSAGAAEILGIRPGTVRMLVSQAKSRLREEGSSDEGPEANA